MPLHALLHRSMPPMVLRRRRKLQNNNNNNLAVDHLYPQLEINWVSHTFPTVCGGVYNSLSIVHTAWEITVTQFIRHSCLRDWGTIFSYCSSTDNHISDKLVMRTLFKQQNAIGQISSFHNLPKFYFKFDWTIWCRVYSGCKAVNSMGKM